MIWDLYQQQGIQSAQNAAHRAGNKADEAAADLARLTRQVEHLTLTCQAMWELLRLNTGLTDENLLAHMLTVDLRDGEADGKIATQTLDCAKCGNKTHSRRKLCVICGEPVVREHIFE
jgi:hypothetical protein